MSDGLKVGELFVNLGIKGSEKTLGALQGVQSGLSKTASLSLEAKAGIVGAMYALERLFAASGAQGTALTNFNALTGRSTKELQQWQYATIQAGGTAQDMTSTVMSLQKAMAGVDLAKGVPEGLLLLSQAAGGIDFSKKDDPFYMMAAFNKAVKNLGNSPKAKAIENYLLGSVNMAPSVIAGMQRGLYNENVFKRAPTYSDKEIGALDRANIAWANLGQKIEMAVGHFNAAHGGQLVKDISKITDAVIKLADALEKVAIKFKLFPALGKFLNGVADVVNVVGEENYFNDKKPDRKSEGILGKILDWRDNAEKKLLDPAKSSYEKQFQSGALSVKPIWDSSHYARPSVAAKPQAPQQNITVKQDLHFQHDGKDHKKTGDSVKKANQDAFRQFHQGQVS